MASPEGKVSVCPAKIIATTFLGSSNSGKNDRQLVMQGVPNNSGIAQAVVRLKPLIVILVAS